MPTFSGKFQYLNTDGTALQGGPCRLAFETDTLTLTPPSGAPLAFDLGDIDVFVAGDYELTLTLFTGKKILLNQFAKAFQNLCHDLLEAYRKRLVQCLLLEDLEEITRFDATVHLQSARSFTSPAELRLFKSNLAVLPTEATGLQWRLADIDAVSFDDASWTVTISSGEESLAVSKLGKRTEEFRERLTATHDEVVQRGAETVHGLFPFLDPDQFQQVVAIMTEGRAAPLNRLRALHPKVDAALAANIVDQKLKPYYDALMAHVPAGNYYSGFKFLRADEDAATKNAHEEEAKAADAEEAKAAGAASEENADDSAIRDGSEEPCVLHWFFLPLSAQPGAALPDNLVAWEATSRSGRASYFFRLVPPEQAPELKDPARAAALIESAIRQLNRAIVLLNFRREPIYLPDDSLQIQPRFRRYAIACRKLPELVRLRSSFLGRAIHTTPEAWQKQFEGYLTAH